MLIYLVLMVLIIVLSPIEKLKIKYKQKTIYCKDIYLLIILCLFTIVMAIRSTDVGVDTSPYSRIYQNILSYSNLKDAMTYGLSNAPIYVFFCRIIGTFFEDPQWLNVFTAIIINFGLYRYIKKTSSNYFLSLFTWYGLALFFFSMNGNRQTIAIVLAMNSFRFLIDNIASKRGWILFILSIGVHTTSMFLLIGLFLIKFIDLIKSKIGIIWYSIGISAIISVLLSKIIEVFSSSFEHYYIYSNGISKYSILTGTGNGRIIILYLFLLFLCLIYYLRFHNNRNLYSTKLLPAITFGVFLGILNSKNELINRMIFFYLALFTSFIPDVVKVFKEKILVKMIIIVILGAYGLLSLSLNQNGIVPYTTFF